jgi:Protein of unknown function (DUF3093)
VDQHADARHACHSGARYRLYPGAVTAAPATFDERLSTPWWWYPAALGIGAILAAQFFLADRGLKVWLPYVIILPIAVVIVWWIGRERVRVDAGEIRVRDAHLPLSAVSSVVALDSQTLRRLVGREADPLAFVAIRPWIGPGVQIVLDDPDDPTPYWVVSTRHPRELVEAMRAAL